MNLNGKVSIQSRALPNDNDNASEELTPVCTSLYIDLYIYITFTNRAKHTIDEYRNIRIQKHIHSRYEKRAQII